MTQCLCGGGRRGGGVGELRARGLHARGLHGTRKGWAAIGWIAGAVLLISTVVPVTVAGAVTAAGSAPAGPPGGDPQGMIYVSDAGVNQIDIFPPGAHGNVRPERIIAGPDTGLSVPADIKGNPAGRGLAANEG